MLLSPVAVVRSPESALSRHVVMCVGAHLKSLICNVRDSSSSPSLQLTFERAHHSARHVALSLSGQSHSEVKGCVPMSCPSERCRADPREPLSTSIALPRIAHLCHQAGRQVAKPSPRTCRLSYPPNASISITQTRGGASAPPTRAYRMPRVLATAMRIRATPPGVNARASAQPVVIHAHPFLSCFTADPTSMGYSCEARLQPYCSLVCRLACGLT